MSETENQARRRRVALPVEDVVEWVGFLVIAGSLVGLVVAASMVSTVLGVAVASGLGLFVGVTAVVLANRVAAAAPGGERR